MTRSLACRKRFTKLRWKSDSLILLSLLTVVHTCLDILKPILRIISGHFQIRDVSNVISMAYRWTFSKRACVVALNDPAPVKLWCVRIRKYSAAGLMFFSAELTTRANKFVWGLASCNQVCVRLQKHGKRSPIYVLDSLFCQLSATAIMDHNSSENQAMSLISNIPVEI